MIDLARVVSMIEEATQAIPDSVDPECTLGDLGGWDSMGLVIFIELVQNETGVQLAVHELRACATPGELVALIQKSVKP